MNIYINEKKLTLEKKISLAEILQHEGLSDSCCAIALNRIFIPKVQHHQTYLQEGDCIDVVAPMQGG